MHRLLTTALRAATTSLALASAADASADVLLYSSDLRWSAVIHDTGGGAGECAALYDNSQPDGLQSCVTQTRHYVRLASSLQFAGALTERMEDRFRLLSFTSTQGAYAATLAATDGSGVLATIHGEMVPGDGGGLRVSLSFADATPSGQLLLSTVVKPFVYVNMNVDGQMTNNVGDWSGDHYHQAANNTGTGNVRWFLARSPVAHASNHDSFMQSTLDGGVAELNNVSYTGPGDINTAVSFGQAALAAGTLHTVAYAVGDEGIAIPASFGSAPQVGAIGLSSVDGRWGATVRTGLGAADFGTAGQIASVLDFDQPVGTSSFLSGTNYYVAAGSSGLPQGKRVSETFARLDFFTPSASPRMFAALLRSMDEPGLVAIIEGKMLGGPSGGLLVKIQYAELGDETLSVTPLVYADLDVDGSTQNVGGEQATHFWQRGAAPRSTNERWFRDDTMSSYQSGSPFGLSLSLDLGATALSSLSEQGPANIASAFAHPPRLVTASDPYVIAFALGNVGISVPASFCEPTQASACPADFDGDGFVGAADLAVLLGSWGPVLPGSPADLNGNATVDAADLALLLGAWGACDDV